MCPRAAMIRVVGTSHPRSSHHDDGCGQQQRPPFAPKRQIGDGNSEGGGVQARHAGWGESSSRPRGHGIACLNDGVLSHVMSNLGLGELGMVEGVCREWRQSVSGEQGASLWKRLLEKAFGSWANAPGRRAGKGGVSSIKDWYRRLLESQRENMARCAGESLCSLTPENLIVVLEVGIISRKSRQKGGDKWMKEIEWFVNDYQPLSLGGCDCMGQFAAFSFQVNKEIRLPDCQKYLAYTESGCTATNHIPIDLQYRVSVCDVGSRTGRPRHSHLIDDLPDEYETFFDDDCGLFYDQSIYRMVNPPPARARVSCFYMQMRCAVCPPSEARPFWIVRPRSAQAARRQSHAASTFAAKRPSRPSTDRCSRTEKATARTS